ncbi:MAG: 2-amino-4-hydroxy-6-hydroxymethyldihydropteridine diphosphokinase [Eudoraea sp.]|uniref:2-amino-4-hydroxy-6- hydroxymethyldihydropteridine diphosphokinase n=1 Tax=Eudoraea sp. TaxID=1979955 RepID=UPI003C73DA6A
MANPKTVILSLGSNLGTRYYNLQKAVFLLQHKVGPVIATSGIYKTPSWGFKGEKFLNACISVHTQKEPVEVLSELLKIEKELGRNRGEGEGYQSRIIDIDLLYYENLICQSEQLNLPHPQLQFRKFVLKPLADIAPQFYHPVLKKDTRNMLQECKDEAILIPFGKPLYKNYKELFKAHHFITIEGNIGAGKTTLATKIASDFNAKTVLERFADNPFLPKFYEDQERYAFPLEMSFLADRYQQFTEDTKQLDLFKDFMVSDYDIYKSLIFANITLSKEEFILYRKLFSLMYKEIVKPGIYIYLYQTPLRLLENIAKRGRSYEAEINESYLEKINRGYLDFLKTYPLDQQLILDISELDFVNKKSDYDYILDRISEQLLKE